MPDKNRAYHMQVRAQSQEQTRLRITESAMELHGTLGPSRTSISAVAALAGVRRSTVYRHFPDEAALFDACSAHWFARNPLPDLVAWANIASPEERLGVAVGEIYAFYRRTESMLENLFRDEATVPLIAERFAAFRGYLGAARATLMAGRKIRGAARRRTRAALGHAIAFSTWQSLARDQGLSDSEAGELVASLVAAAGGGASGGARPRARRCARGVAVHIGSGPTRNVVRSHRQSEVCDMGAPIRARGQFSRVVRFDPRAIKRAVGEVEGVNAKVALIITRTVGTMACAYVFALIALISLPAAINSGQVIIIVAWIAQTFLQLVLLSIIMVGQSVQSAASDARAAKEFADTETILDRLDTKTAGGIREVLEAIQALGTSKGAAPAGPGQGEV